MATKYFPKPDIFEDPSTECDGSCSSMDPVGSRLVPHAEVEAGFDRALGLSWYDRFMRSMERNHPGAYKFLKSVGLSYRA
jgi:hypothetical protein